MQAVSMVFSPAFNPLAQQGHKQVQADAQGFEKTSMGSVAKTITSLT